MADNYCDRSKQTFHGNHFKRKPNFYAEKGYARRKKGNNHNNVYSRDTHLQLKNLCNKNGTDVNVSERQPDSELFFFDISGNKSNLEAAPPYEPKNQLKHKNNRLRISRKFLPKYKWERNGTPDTETLRRIDGTDKSKENNSTNLQSPEFKMPKKKKRKRRKSRSKSTDSGASRFGETEGSFKDIISMSVPLLEEIDSGILGSNLRNRSSINIPPVAKKGIENNFKKRPPNVTPLSNIEIGSWSKEKATTELPQLDQREIDDNCKKKYSCNLSPLNETLRNKKKHKEILIDIRDSDCEMVSYDVSDSESGKQVENRAHESVDIQENLGPDAKTYDKNKKGYENESALSTKKKKKELLQDVNEVNVDTSSDKTLREEKIPAVVVDVPDSDCELTAKPAENRVSISPKKKKKKKINENNSEESECKTDDVGVLANNLPNNNVQLSDKKTALLKDENELISEIIQQIKNDISYIKKKKKKRSPDKKSTDKEISNNSTILVDLRDSECEMTVVTDSHRKKKKKRKRNVEEKDMVSVQNNGEKCQDLNDFNDIDATNEADANAIPSKKKKRKHLQIDTIDLDLIEPNNKEMVSYNVDSESILSSDQSIDSSVKKKKRKKVTSESGLEHGGLSFEEKNNSCLENEVTKSDNVSTLKKKHKKTVSGDQSINENTENTIKSEDEAILINENTKKKKRKKDKNHKRKYTDEIIDVEIHSSNINEAEKKSPSSPNGKKKKRRSNGESEDTNVENENVKNANGHRAMDESIFDATTSEDHEDGETSVYSSRVYYKDMEDEKNTQAWTFEDEESEMEKDDMIRKWQRLVVNISFKVAPLHALGTRTSKPTKEQTEEIERLNLEVKRGPFTKKEDEIILHNWQTFCKVHKFPMKPKLYVTLPRGVSQDKKVEFLRYISQGLDNRMIHRVYARFRSLMSKETAKIGRFTAEEDRQILKYINESLSGRPFSELSKITGRTRDALFKRYRRLIATQNWTVQWTPELISSFLSYLQKITKVSDVNELQYRKISLKEWKKLSKKMNPIPVVKLQMAWQNTIYPRLFVCEGVDLREIKAGIIKRLIKKKETDWRAVDWERITKKFPGFSSHKIYMMFKQLVIFHVPKEKQGDLKECLSFLNEKLLIYNIIPTTHAFKKIDLDDHSNAEGR